MPPEPSAPSSKPRNPPRSTRSMHDRSGSVPEQHARGAIVPVHDLREQVGADDERAAADPGGEHRVRLRDGVDESRAPGREVVGARLRRAELVGHDRGSGRKRHVGRDRGDDDEIEILRADAGAARALPARRAGRSRTAPRPGRPRAARGCPSAPRSTRPTCPPSAPARRSSAPAREPTSRGR